jgi:hypothetical protein
MPLAHTVARWLFWPPLGRGGRLGLSISLSVVGRSYTADPNERRCREPAVQSYGPGSTEPSAARGPCTSARGIINTTTRCSASARGINATASACTGARGRFDGEAASTSTSTSGGHNEAASACTRAGAGSRSAPPRRGTSTGRHAAPPEFRDLARNATTATARHAADATLGQELLGNRGRAATAADTTTTSTRATTARDGAGGRRRRLRDALPPPARRPHVGRARGHARAPRPFGVRRRVVSYFVKTHRE